MTADEFLALPVSARGWPADLIGGEVVVNDPAALHGHVQGNLFIALVGWTRAEPKRGTAVVPGDIAIDEHNVFKPDVLCYADGRLPDPHSPPPYAMPDLVAEVRSPSTWRYDIGAKKSGYERGGLPELWLVDTVARSVLVFRRSRVGGEWFDVALEIGEDAHVQTPLLPGFALRVGDLFHIE
jgi:Uma2 family endonuclease